MKNSVIDNICPEHLDVNQENGSSNTGKSTQSSPLNSLQFAPC